MRAQDEWPPRSGAARRRGHTEPGLQAGWRFDRRKRFSVRRLRPSDQVSSPVLAAMSQTVMEALGVAARRADRSNLVETRNV